MMYRSIPVTHYQQNCSILWCDETKEAAIIDPGGDVDRIQAALDELALKPAKILLTHGHLDHVGGVAQLSKALGLPIIGPHKDDAFWIAGVEAQAKMMGFGSASSFTPNQWLSDGDRVQVGQCELEVVHCPGHTPGHVVFYSRGQALAFVGDVLFSGSIGRTDFPKGNLDDLVYSIRKKLFPLGDDVRFVPGHGPESSFGHERKTNPFVADTRFG